MAASIDAQYLGTLQRLLRLAALDLQIPGLGQGWEKRLIFSLLLELEAIGPEACEKGLELIEVWKERESAPTIRQIERFLASHRRATSSSGGS